MLVTSPKFALMDCYGHGILVKMCYTILRKRIIGMKLTEFVQENVSLKFRLNLPSDVFSKHLVPFIFGI